MSELKDLYVEKIGHEYARIETSLGYLSELSSRGATELDAHLLGRNHGFSHVRELAGILGRYQLKDTDTASTWPHFPYLPLWRAVRKDSGKELRRMSELALDMRLFRSELEDVPANPKRVEELRSLLCGFSRELSNERYQHNPLHRLVA